MKKDQAKFLMRQVTVTNKQKIKWVLHSLKNLRNEYPGFNRWFNTTVKPGLADGSRQLWLAVTADRRIAGVLILKNCEGEKKISTLYVYKAFRRQGVGILMMQTAFRQLGTNTPLATVSSERLPEYGALFERFEFKLSKVYQDYYRTGISEYAYNGELVDTKYGIAANE